MDGQLSMSQYLELFSATNFELYECEVEQFCYDEILIDEILDQCRKADDNFDLDYSDTMSVFLESIFTSFMIIPSDADHSMKTILTNALFPEVPMLDMSIGESRGRRIGAALRLNHLEVIKTLPGFII